MISRSLPKQCYLGGGGRNVASDEEVSCAQFVDIFELTGWQDIERLRDMLDLRYSGCATTQICEDLIGSGKNSGQAKTGRFFRRPERTMHAGLKQGILHERGEFRLAVPELVAMTSRGDKLPKSAFCACPADRAHRRHKQRYRMVQPVGCQHPDPVR